MRARMRAGTACGPPAPGRSWAVAVCICVKYIIYIIVLRSLSRYQSRGARRRARLACDYSSRCPDNVHTTRAHRDTIQIEHFKNSNSL